MQKKDIKVGEHYAYQSHSWGTSHEVEVVALDGGTNSRGQAISGITVKRTDGAQKDVKFTATGRNLVRTWAEELEVRERNDRVAKERQGGAGPTQRPARRQGQADRRPARGSWRARQGSTGASAERWRTLRSGQSGFATVAGPFNTKTSSRPGSTSSEWMLTAVASTRRLSPWCCSPTPGSPSRGSEPWRSARTTTTTSSDDIMRYEDGSMDETEAVAFFSRLIKSGMIPHLQGSYGRGAEALIKIGYLAA
jgi:hypothetical protein